jgi:hypothetical protein
VAAASILWSSGRMGESPSVSSSSTFVSDLLRRRSLRPLGGGGRLFDDREDIGLGLVRELHERAVRDAIGGNDRAFEPPAVDELEEVVLRPHGSIEERDIQAGLQVGLPRPGERQGGRHHHACQAGPGRHCRSIVICASSPRPCPDAAPAVAKTAKTLYCDALTTNPGRGG